MILHYLNAKIIKLLHIRKTVSAAMPINNGFVMMASHHMLMNNTVQNLTDKS